MMYAIFAPRHLLRRYLAAGWRLVGTCIGHHGAWSVLLVRDDAP